MSKLLSLRDVTRIAVPALCALFSLQAATAAETGYSGKAYGTELAAAAVAIVNAGPSAVSKLCTESTGVTNSNDVAGVSLPNILSTGAIDTSVASTAGSNSTASTATSNVTGINVLTGTITADAIKSVSSSISTSGTYSTSSNGTLFTNVNVLGVAISANVAPNTRINLPGLGYVILNQQISDVTASSARLTVNGVHVFVTTANSLNLPVGAELIVAHAESDTLANITLIHGLGYGSSLTAAGILDSGRTAVVTLGCTGTSGQLHQNDVTGVVIPGVLGTGELHTTAQGSVTATGTMGQVTATVDGTNLLSGLLTATAIKAVANGSDSMAAIDLNSTGSGFVDLSVTGHPEIGANPPPNTKVQIAGLGTLWLHRVIRTPDSIQVRMVELIVNAGNALGLPIGADLRLSVAELKFEH